MHFVIVMIRWTGLAPWEFEFPFPGSLTSTFLVHTRRRYRNLYKKMFWHKVVHTRRFFAAARRMSFENSTPVRKPAPIPSLN